MRKSSFKLVGSSVNPPSPAEVSIRIRLATSADIPAIVKLERQCPTAAHWSQQQYQAAFQADTDKPARLVLVAEASPPARQRRKSQPLAFLVARNLGPEWELENIAVVPSARRKGLGSRLINEFSARARGMGGESTFLEVRESNLVARSLYEKAGLTRGGRRASYYREPSEDAILYRGRL